MAQAAADLSSIRQGTDAANRRFEEAFNRGDIAGAVEGVYTRDARVLPPGAEMVQGRDNIVQFWQGAVQQMGLKRVELSTVELEAQGDTAYEIGRATLTVGDGQQAVGKYVVIWNQEGGSWRWHIDIFNMNSA